MTEGARDTQDTRGEREDREEQNVRSILYSKDAFDRTPLDLACVKGYTKIALFLSKHQRLREGKHSKEGERERRKKVKGPCETQRGKDKKEKRKADISRRERGRARKRRAETCSGSDESGWRGIDPSARALSETFQSVDQTNNSLLRHVAVESGDNLSVEDFVRDYVSLHRPVLITNLLQRGWKKESGRETGGEGEGKEKDKQKVEFSWSAFVRWKKDNFLKEFSNLPSVVSTIPYADLYGKVSDG